jgi:CheY-like chemotaxis protein
MSNLPRSILIVEDDISLRETLSLIFSEAGDEVRSAADGLAALGKIIQTTPDVLISDLNMPGMSGFELLQIVERLFPHIHVIAMSGAFAGDQVPVGVTADAFFAKGTGSITKLLQLAHAATGRKPPHRQVRAAPWLAEKNGTQRP